MILIKHNKAPNIFSKDSLTVDANSENRQIAWEDLFNRQFCRMLLYSDMAQLSYQHKLIGVVWKIPMFFVCLIFLFTQKKEKDQTAQSNQRLSSVDIYLLTLMTLIKQKVMIDYD